jgi:Domain of unknown function (DUF4261)
MSDKLSTTYMVELLYEAVPHIDGAALLSELQKRCGKVDRLGDKDDFYLYAFPDHIIEYKDGKIPAQALLAYPDKGKEKLNLEEALQQSWGWPEAREAVVTCRVPLLLTEMMARGLEYKTRLGLFHNALESVLTIAPCKAIHWVTSQQLVNPSAYLEARKSGDFHPLQFALNVRFYNVSSGKRGEMFMDTMGLGIFGLPDLQCHFLNLDQNQVARALYNSAYYIFDKGDIIRDGNTIQGIKPTDKWRCQREVSLVGPEREVLDLNPGRPYAAGKRK